MMASYGGKKRRARRRFLKDRRGAAAVEFAIVAPVFLALMFSTFEVGWFYFANSVTDAATTAAARLVRTGQVQNWTGSDAEKFQRLYDVICNVVGAFGPCNTHLTVEVNTFPSFSALAADTSAATCANDTPADIAALAFTPGAELQIARVRVCLLYTTVNPAIGLKLAEPGTSTRRIVSAAVFRNEPYEKNKK
jgi:Flp pilus assembly protein TadG